MSMKQRKISIFFAKNSLHVFNVAAKVDKYYSWAKPLGRPVHSGSFCENHRGLKSTVSD